LVLQLVRYRCPLGHPVEYIEHGVDQGILGKGLLLHLDGKRFLLAADFLGARDPTHGAISDLGA
jgi:hypothetical protein